MREIIYSDEFSLYIENLNKRTQEKIYYYFEILITQKFINSLIAKKLTNSYFYELRVKTDNEYRLIFFCIDHENLMEAKKIIILSGFLKKTQNNTIRRLKKQNQ